MSTGRNTVNNRGGKSNNHILFRSSNPALSSKTFDDIPQSTGNVMTIDGTVNKIALSLFILLAFGYMTFRLEITGLIFLGFIGGFIVAIITMFKKSWSPVTTPVYAALEGLALGGISFVFNSMYEGIVFQAVFLTLAILFSLLFAYKTKLIKPTENFKLGVVAATGGIFVVYMVGFIMSFFGSGLPVLDIGNSSFMSIGFSLLVVIIASLNLVLDFDFIEQGAEQGAPKYMEWYAAFGLMITLVWLYIEILHLLAKLRGR